MKGLIVAVLCLIAWSECHLSVVVDVSHWQRQVDFKEAKADGIHAVIHKATEGKTYVDPNYAERRTLAEREGLLWGAYHFGNGGPSGREQADNFLRTVGNTSKVLLVLDLEANPSGRTMTLQHAEDFVARVKEFTGRLPLLYSSPSFLASFRSPLLDQCSLWVAHWTAAEAPRLPAGRKSWVFWQYTNGKSGGSPREVRGIGSCDRDRFNGDLDLLKATWPNF